MAFPARVPPAVGHAFPPGSSAADLVPAAGGGFRGLVRSGTSRIGGQVRLVKARPGLPVPLGPALGLMALTVITEMAAAAEQDRKLTAILTTVERIDARLRLESDARLRTAEQAIRQAHAALLDRAVIPESVGLGAAMSHVQDIRNMSVSLASTALTISARDAGVLPHLITDAAVENARTQALFAGLAAATDGAGHPSSGSAGFDAELTADGGVRILEPAAPR